MATSSDVALQKADSAEVDALLSRLLDEAAATPLTLEQLQFVHEEDQPLLPEQKQDILFMVKFRGYHHHCVVVTEATLDIIAKVNSGKEETYEIVSSGNGVADTINNAEKAEGFDPAILCRYTTESDRDRNQPPYYIAEKLGVKTHNSYGQREYLGDIIRQNVQCAEVPVVRKDISMNELGALIDRHKNVRVQQNFSPNLYAALHLTSAAVHYGDKGYCSYGSWLIGDIQFENSNRAIDCKELSRREVSQIKSNNRRAALSREKAKIKQLQKNSITYLMREAWDHVNSTKISKYAIFRSVGKVSLYRLMRILKVFDKFRTSARYIEIVKNMTDLELSIPTSDKDLRKTLKFLKYEKKRLSDPPA